MSSVVISGDTSGQITLAAPAVSGTNTITLPAATGTMLTTAGGQTITGNTTVSGTVVMGSPFTMRNKIINGAMVIDQRNAGAATTPSGVVTYVIDRFNYTGTQASKFTLQQVADAPAGFYNSQKITVASTATPSASDQFRYGQIIEGFNCYDLAWGTASAQTVTVSFWAKVSVAGTYSVGLWNGGIANYSYVTSFAFTTSWARYSFTVQGPTSGTWQTGNSSCIDLMFDLGSGSNFTTSTLNTWQVAQCFKASGSVNLVTNSSATMNITGVQFEIGTAATPFEYRNYQQELAMCQRYFQLNNSSLAYGLTSSGITFQYNPPVYLRAAPTLSLTTTTPYWESVAWSTIGSLTSATVDGSHISSSGGDIRINGTFSPAPSYGSLSLIGSSFVRISAEL